MSRLFLAVFDVKIDILNLDICTTNTLTADKKAFIDDNTCVYYFENICVLQILENQLYTFAELEDLKIKLKKLCFNDSTRDEIYILSLNTDSNIDFEFMQLCKNKKSV